MVSLIHFQARLLGPPFIEFNGIPIQVDTRKAIALLAYLVVAGDQQPRDLLAALFWPDLDQTRARSALRRTLSSLKQSLGGEGLAIARESIGLDASAGWWIDLREFESHLSAISNHTHSIQACHQRISHLTAAVDLVRGEFLAGFSLRDSVSFDDWQSLQSAKLRQELTLTLENLTDCHAYLGDYEQAIIYARRSQIIEPLNEKAARELMKLYTWSGRRDAGLQQYHDLVRVLDSELHVAPSQETTQLYTEILENNLIPPHIPRVRTEVQSYRDFVRSPKSFPLVGRQPDWDQLIDFYASSASIRAFTAIEGEIGVGKTRFAEEFLSYASRNGSVVIGARFFQGEVNLPYGPFVEGLRSAINLPGLTEMVASLPDLWKVEIARLLPEVAHLPSKVKVVSSAESPSSQVRMFEAVDRLIQWVCQGPHPGILFLDDLQWADNASVDLLIYLLQKSSGQPLFILGTWRREDIRPGHRLRNLLVDAQRSGRGRLIRLKRLHQTDVAELIRAIPGKPFSDNLIEKLYQDSEGLPYFLTEYLSVINLQESQANSDEIPLPASIRELLHSRLAQLSQPGITLLSTAAVVGRSFDFDTVCNVSLQSEDTCIRSLEELLTRGLIQATAGRNEDDEISFDFMHDKLRSLVYEEISRPRRRLLHKSIANALVQRAFAVDQSSLSGQIAFHYRQAGEILLAAQYYRQAGEYARSIFAIPDALNHFQTALSLGHPERGFLQEAIGDLQTLLGSYTLSIESYQASLLDLPPSHAASIYYKLAQVNHRLGDWIVAEEHFKNALQHQAASNDIVLKIDVFVDWALTALYKDGLAAAQTLANQALLLAQQSQDCRSLSQVHNILGILSRKEGQTSQAFSHLESSLEFAEMANDRASSIAALNNFALTYGERGDFHEAIFLAQKALELCAIIGDRHREAALLSNLADLYYQSGDADTAMILIKKSVAIFSEIGTASGDIQPEIWKLTEW
jgi:DNA-binding SARP family transcriptional activator